jgi:NADH-quinone oxidoreductase subunit A
MGSEFTPIFLFIVVAAATALSMWGLSAVLGPRRKTATKGMPYESGMDPIGDARQRFDVRYYLVAIAFLLFDVELLFLYPWAVAQWSIKPGPVVVSTIEGNTITSHPLIGVGIPPDFRWLVFGEIVVFVAVLATAFAYAWKKGVFEWR